MRKRILASIVCAALSASMMMGTAMVGAAENSVRANVPEVIGISNVSKSENVESASGTVSKKVLKNAKAKTIKNATASTTLWNINNWNNFFDTYVNGNYAQAQYAWECVSPGICKVGEIKVGVNGEVLVPYEAVYTTTSGTRYTTYLSLTSLDGKTVYAKGSKGLIYGQNLKAGTYGLYTTYGLSAGQKIAGTFSVAAVSNQSNRWLGKALICVGANGGKTYEYFKMSKRGLATIGAMSKYHATGTNGVGYYIQKKSGRSWKTVSSSVYTSNSSGYVNVYGLNSGTYRAVFNKGLGYTMFLGANTKSYYSSYGTKKSKAKTISRKKSKSNVILTTDSTKTTHWYKVKVSKTRNTYIDVTALGTSGTISAAISGKTRLKSKNIKNGKRFYGKAKKGTYYIQVKRYSKSTSGAYKVKYTK